MATVLVVGQAQSTASFLQQEQDLTLQILLESGTAIILCSNHGHLHTEITISADYLLSHRVHTDNEAKKPTCEILSGVRPAEQLLPSSALLLQDSQERAGFLT